MRARFAPLLAALLVLAGCSQRMILEKLAPTEVQTRSKEAVADLQSRRFDSLRERLVSDLRRQDLTASFEKMAAAFPDEEPRSVKIVGFVASTGSAGPVFDVSYEYEFSHIWVVADLAWVRVNGGLRLASFNVFDHALSLEQMNAFTLKGKDASHYGILALGVFALGATLVALVKCVRAKGLKRKWLWFIFILFGFGSIALNWTTGQWRFGLLNFQLLSFSAFAPFGGPWTVAVSVPVGALVFLLRRRGREPSQVPAAEGQPPPA